ncbi:hypothetical protein N665_3763s0003 [Sinapis alba]|nr:hypothetical protein N665_3763s0003 [Sinapis alba]
MSEPRYDSRLIPAQQILTHVWLQNFSSPKSQASGETWHMVFSHQGDSCDNILRCS